MPDSLQPANFVVEFIGNDGKVIADTSFNFAFDDGSKKTFDTDDDGIIKMQKPSGEVKVTARNDSGADGDGEDQFNRYHMK